MTALLLAGGVGALAVGLGLWWMHKPAETDDDQGEAPPIGGERWSPPIGDEDVPMLNIGVTQPSKPKPTGPGSSADNPAIVPSAGQWYRVQSGDTGSRIVRIAYNVPSGGGKRVRAWLDVRAHTLNALLKRPSDARWSGDLLPAYKHGRGPQGSGNRLPIIYLPEPESVDW